MNGWVDLGAIQWFSTRDPWLGIQRLSQLALAKWLYDVAKWKSDHRAVLPLMTNKLLIYNTQVTKILNKKSKIVDFQQQKDKF